MTKDSITSYNSRQETKEDLQHIFWPSWLEFSMYLVAGALLLLLLNASAIWNYFNSSTLEQENFKDLLAQSIPGVDSLSRVAQGRVFLVVFWMIVGSLIYLLYWFVKSIFINFRNDIVVVEYFVHPKSFNKTRYWLSVMNRNLFFVANCIVLIAYIYASIRLVVVLGKFCNQAFLNFRALTAFPRLALSVLCTAILFHLLFMLLHITVRSWRHAA